MGFGRWQVAFLQTWALTYLKNDSVGNETEKEPKFEKRLLRDTENRAQIESKIGLFTENSG